MSLSDEAKAKRIKFGGITFLVRIKDFDNIEERNSLRVNVFSYEDKQKYPIRLSKMTRGKEVNVLLITEGEKWH